MTSKTIDTSTNFLTISCPKCGKELKVDTSTGLSDGINYWHDYNCPHCGYMGSIKDNESDLDSRAYQLDELYKNLKQASPLPIQGVKEDNSLQRIADTLDDIKDLLKELLRK